MLEASLGECTQQCCSKFLHSVILLWKWNVKRFGMAQFSVTRPAIVSQHQLASTLSVGVPITPQLEGISSHGL